MGFRSLAVRTGISLFEAGEILARLRARFHRFEDYAQSVRDHAGLRLEIGTPFGWWMQCPSGMNPRTIRNFPIQSTGSEILHVACVLAERRGIEIVAPVHDAIMAEGPADQVEELSAALDQVMGDAAAVVLRGYRLPTDCQIIRPGERYFDDRGEAMWDHGHPTAGQAGTGDGVMGTDIDSLFEDVENDPLWQMAGLLANAPPRPAKGYVYGSAGVAGAGAAGGSHHRPISSWPCCSTGSASCDGATLLLCPTASCGNSVSAATPNIGLWLGCARPGRSRSRPVTGAHG